MDLPNKNKSNDSSCKNCDRITLLINHATKYFEIHANQRITLFRFYIAFYTFFLAGSGFLAVRFAMPGIFAEVSGILISVFFIIITVVFHLLDRRNRQLIHYGEDALREIENKYLINNSDLSKVKVFTRERLDIYDKKSYISHTACFRTIYILAYVSAGILFVTALYRIFS